MSRPIGWLSPEDAEKARRMEDFVMKEWRPEGDATPFTPHDPAHFMRVENWIRKLIPEERWSLLTYSERKLLTWSAWTHDIGMFRKIHAQGASDATIRDQHVNASAVWVAEHHNHLQLESLVEAQVLAEVNLFHSRKNAINSCPEHRLYCGEPVRTRLLASYLRLADALEVTHDRVESDLHPRFDLLIHQMSRENDNTLFHWVKSFVVAGISVDHQRKLLTVEFMRDHGLAEGKFEQIKRYVINEIEDELDSVEHVLAAGGISSVHFVDFRDVNVIAGRVQAQLKESVHRVLNFIQMTRSPNSTAVTMAALDAAAALVERTNKEASNKEAVDFFEGLELLEKTLAHQLQTRGCHTELRRVHSFIRKITHQFENSKSPRKLEECIKDLETYTQRFVQHIGHDKERDRHLANHFYAVLREKSPNLHHMNFVLFGCSETVARCLASLQGRQLRTNSSLTYSVWIAEGHPKTQYGAHNVPTYCDAITYVQTLVGAGCHPREINILPDACVATLIDRGVSNTDHKIDAVLFGTNGIYLHDDVYVAHSAGHLGIAMIASTAKVPVIVLGAAAKIFEGEPIRDWRSSSRGAAWFTPNTTVLCQLEKKAAVHVQRNWNPREDHVPLRFLTAIVTEKGIVRGKEPGLRRMLGAWMKEAAGFLENPPKPKRS